jgi:ABC-type nitrate/sulfonate/bicarbonate transport system substrate-binding protein
MIRSRKYRLAIALLLVFGLVAAACGSDDDDSSSSDDEAATADDAAADDAAADDAAGDDAAADECIAPADGSTETITFQLDWVPNTNHTGLFVADEMGWYAEEGIEWEVLPYSGGNGDTIVAEGAADFAVSFQNSIVLARPAGVPITAVAAVLQQTAEAIAVVADRDDLASPKDLDGQLYAGFGGPFEVPVMTAIIQADGGEGEFEAVILDTAAYEAVYNGSADFVIPFKTWEGIEAELTGQPLKYFEYEDYGAPSHYSVIIVAADDWLAENDCLTERFLRATQRGYEFGAANPDEASQILIDANPGVFNDEELVFTSQELMANEYFLDENGTWGLIDDARFAAYSGWLYDAGIVVDGQGNPLPDEPDWTEYHDTSNVPS